LNVSATSTRITVTAVLPSKVTLWCSYASCNSSKPSGNYVQPAVTTQFFTQCIGFVCLSQSILIVTLYSPGYLSRYSDSLSTGRSGDRMPVGWDLRKRPDRPWGRGSTSCVPRSRNCISCVPLWPLQVYQLRPGFSTPSTTAASRDY
jgi:hypothetical protein